MYEIQRVEGNVVDEDTKMNGDDITDACMGHCVGGCKTGTNVMLETGKPKTEIVDHGRH